MSSEKSKTPYYFLGLMIIAYLIIGIINFETLKKVFSYFIEVLLKILPVFIIIFVLMALIDFFVKPKKLIKYLGSGSGKKGWLIAIIGGIISSGPIYMWYPLFNDLQKRGMRPALISAFLYNRAVKIPLLPLMIAYFGVKFSILLSVVMIFISIFQGLATEKLMKVI